MASYLLLIFAALAAGLINSVAGGGLFLTFPALVFTGVPSIIANASSTVALFRESWRARGPTAKTSRNRRISRLAVADRQPGWRHGGRAAAAVHAAEDLRFGNPLADAGRNAPVHVRPAHCADPQKRWFHIGPVTVVVIQFLSPSTAAISAGPSAS